MSAGVRIAAFIVGLTMASFTLGAMGWYGAANVGFTTGLQDDVSERTNRLQNTSASVAEDAEGFQPGFFGLAIGAIRAVVGMLTLTYRTYGIAVSWGVHPAMAASIQVMVDLAFGLTVAVIALRFDFWRA